MRELIMRLCLSDIKPMAHGKLPYTAYVIDGLLYRPNARMLYFLFWPTVLSVEPLARCVVCRLSVCRL